MALGPDADPESVARKILLDQLTGRARTRHELAAKLAAKGVPDEIAGRLLDRFTEVGLIDDAAFARLWVESRQSGKGLARRALAAELRRKGVADEVARGVLDELEPGDEEEAARALVRKKLRSLQAVDRATATRRLAGMLARKGYPPAWRSPWSATSWERGLPATTGSMGPTTRVAGMPDLERRLRRAVSAAVAPRGGLPGQRRPDRRQRRSVPQGAAGQADGRSDAGSYLLLRRANRRSTPMARCSRACGVASAMWATTCSSLYLNPDGSTAISPGLRKRMQGKPCFDFTGVDDRPASTSATR